MDAVFIRIIIIIVHRQSQSIRSSVRYGRCITCSKGRMSSAWFLRSLLILPCQHYKLLCHY